MAVLLVAGLAVALAGGGGDKTEKVVASKKPPETTTTTRDPAEVRAEAEFRSFLEKMENILDQSAGGRGQVGRLVSGVENGCSIDPYDASQQIQVVIDNRTTILNQLAALNVPPDPAAQNVHSILQRALQSSIDADIQYKAWFNYLYNDYYYIDPVGCPNGFPPKDSAFDAARSADVNSSSLKQQFVDAFNPIAFGFGLRTWMATEF